MKYAYFDQWVWIELSKCFHNKKTSHPVKQSTVEKVIESSNISQCIFPFSICHIEETLKRKDVESKKRLLKFIFEISKFHTIIPWTKIIELEVRNAILESLNVSPIDLSKSVFKDDLGGIFNANIQIVPREDLNREPSEEEFNNLKNALKDPEIMANALCTFPGNENLHSLSEFEPLAKQLESLRKVDYGQKDKKKRRDTADYRFFVDFISKYFIDALDDFNIDITKYFDQIIDSKEKATEFMKSIPTGYVFHTLNYSRNINFGRQITANDIYDLNALSIAVPYCDIVVAEKEWSNILRHQKIDKLYNTKITHKIDDLSNLL